MPLLKQDWKTLFLVYWYANKDRYPEDTCLSVLRQQLLAQYRQLPVGSSHEALFILGTLERAVQKAAASWASLMLAPANTRCRQSFCSGLRNAFFYENGPVWSLLDYTLTIVPAYRRAFYRKIERFLGEAYQSAKTSRNELLKTRVVECAKERDDFCVACQKSGSELRGVTVVFLPNCAHTALCTPCFLAWSGASARCPVCRTPF